MEQTRWYLMRPPSSRCTWWKRMSFSSVAEYSFTAIDTRPKDTAPFQIDRMLDPLSDVRPSDKGSHHEPLPCSLHRALAAQTPSMGRVAGAPFAPMLATPGPLPGGAGWAYELKWDGVRALVECVTGATRLYARKGHEITVAYPELAGLCADAPDAVLDGEVVVFDASGRPSFRDLAERMHVRERLRAGRLAVSTPVTFLAFDVLRLRGVDLLDVPYSSRRLMLEELDLNASRWMTPPAFDDGAATMAAAGEN